MSVAVASAGKGLLAGSLYPTRSPYPRYSEMTSTELNGPVALGSPIA
jgi:hypothetical protein